MMTWNPQANELFLRAIELAAPDERRRFLDGACDGDAVLRAEVEGLLAAGDQAGSFLEVPANAAYLAATLQRPIAEQPGTLIGRYKLLEQIGEGGFGVVFMAEQQEPVRRKVALKVLKPGMDTRQVVARFEAERQALALMDHPNIAHVFDGGTTDTGRPYFVMELVRGVPITEFCDQNCLAIRQRLELFVNVCQAVQHAHQKGIIHRDIKPTNVLITLHDDTPVVKVIDFGIAKAMGQQLTEKTLFTNFAQMIGTPLYMSPEQAAISGLDIDTRGDIYSLGVLLYELLTGTTPFENERLTKVGYDEMRRIIREEEPPKPSTRISTIAKRIATACEKRQSDPRKLSRLFRGELDWIVMKALEKDRNRRYDSAHALAMDIERYLNDDAVAACPPSSWYRLRKLARRKKAMLAVIAAISLGLILAVGGLAGAVKVLADTNAQIKDKQKRTDQALQAEKRAAQQLTESMEREVLTSYYRSIQLADREFEANNPGRAEELLDECPVTLRGWEWHYLKGRRNREPVVFRGHEEAAGAVAFSADGKYVASGGSNSRLAGDLKVWDPASGKTIRDLVGHAGPVSGVAFSRDGKNLASVSWDGSLRVWDVSTWQPRHVLRGHTGSLNCVACSPDSQVVASGGNDRLVKLWDLDTGEEVRTLHGHTGGIEALSFSPDGACLASAGHDQSVRVWDVQTGQVKHHLRGHAGTVLALAYRRDGQRLASAGFDGVVKIWDVTTGRAVRSVRCNILFTSGVAFNREGTRLATAGWDKAVMLWDVEHGQEVLALRGHGDMASLTFSEDGRRLASASLDGTVRLWDATPGQRAGRESLALRGHTDTATAVLFSPDGGYLVSACLDGAVKFWDPHSGEEIRSLTGGGPALSLAFSDDGRRLAAIGIGRVVNLWEVATGKEIGPFRGAVGLTALSPDGHRLAWPTEALDVEVRDTGTRRVVLKFPTTHLAPVVGVSYSPDGKRLATTSWDKTAKIWDADNGTEILTLHGHEHRLQNVAFSPDGRRLATSSWDETARVWNTATGKELFTLRGHRERVGHVAFSPDGKYLATASYDHTAKIWDLTNGAERLTLAAHAGYVGSVAFSPDGKQLATAGGYRGKGEIKLWDASLWEGTPDR